MRAFIFRTVVSVCGISISAAALAQSEAQPTAGTTDAQKEGGATLGQVVVTAQRRNEILAQTPIAASVLSGGELAEKGVASVDSLQFVSPSVAVNNFGQGVEFNIRGIGKAEMSALTTTGVITYRDAVPSFPGFFQGEPYFDVSNIQILRGPQGTVVGQNSTGGAVFVNTNNPVIGGDYNGYVTLSAGNYNDIGKQGALNIPISETLAVRFAFFDEQRNSFYNVQGPNGTAYNTSPLDMHEQAARIGVLWEPTDKLSILWKTDVDDLNMGAYVVSKPRNGFSTIPGTNTPNPTYSDLFNVSANAPMEARDQFTRTSLKVDYALDSGVKVRSVTGYARGTSKWIADFDGTANGIPAIGPFPATPNNYAWYSNPTETQVSQEFNIISPDNQQLTWLAGLFAVQNRYDFDAPDGTFAANYNTTFNGTPFAPFFQYKFNGSNPQQSQAVFGQIGYAFTPNLKVDLGVRYTDSSSSNNFEINQLGTKITQNQSSSEQNTSYKLSLGWKLDPNNYVYATNSTGFKPGGLNLQTAPGVQAAPFTKEEILSYELGWKANTPDGKGHLTLSGFYSEYKGFQASIGNPVAPTIAVIGNATGTTTMSGIELEADYKFGGLTIDAGISSITSSLGQFYAVDQRISSPVGCNPNTGPATAACVNLQGRQLSYAPPLTYNLSAKYDLAVWDGKLTPVISLAHVDPQWASLFQNSVSGDQLAARDIVNAQITYQRRKTSVTLYGTNLTDQHYVAAHWLVSAGNLDFAGPPRQYGIKLTQAF